MVTFLGCSGLQFLHFHCCQKQQGCNKRGRAHRDSLWNSETKLSACKLRCHWSILGDDRDKFGPPLGIYNSQKRPFTSLFHPASVTDTLPKIAQRKPRKRGGDRICKCQNFELRTWRLVSLSARRLFWIICASLPYCPVKQKGQATKSEHMPAFPCAARPDMCYFLLTLPTCSAKPFG